MKYQKDTYSCGAAAVVNALRSFGKKVTERSVRVFSSTTKDHGTDEHGIIAALRGLGFDGEVIESENISDILATLNKSFQYGPVIICIQNLQHWVTVIGQMGDWENSYFVVDPSRTLKNKRENGVHVMTKSQLIKTWQSRNGKFFGVSCKKKFRSRSSTG